MRLKDIKDLNKLNKDIWKIVYNSYGKWKN